MRGVQGALAPVENLISSNLGLALGGAFAVFSTVQAVQFEKSMNRLIGLVGLSKEEVAGLSEEVLNLSTVVPVGPQELADSLYFIESSGIQGAEAIDVLTVSAKASAAQLGDTATIADLLTSALNAYAGSGLTATQITDQLVAAVRLGKSEPDEMAKSLGQVLPIASQMGVEFNEVASSIAAVSLAGLSTPRAATGLRYLLSSLAKPSQEAIAHFSEIGLSVQDVQDMLANRGLLETLRTLAERFDISGAAGKAAFQSIIGGARGGVIAMALVGRNAEQVDKVFAGVSNSAGEFEHAFVAAGETFAFKFKQFATQVQALAIRLGTALLPVLTQVFQVLTLILKPIITLVGWLTKIPGLVQAITYAFIAWKGIPFIVNTISTVFTFLGGVLTRLGITSATSAAETTASTGLIQAALVRLGIQAQVTETEVVTAYAGIGRAAATYMPTAAAETSAAGAEMSAAGAGIGVFAGAMAAATIGVTAIITEITYFNALAAKSKQLREDLTNQVTDLSSSLKPLQENLGLTNEEFSAWIAAQRAGQGESSEAAAAYGKYDEAIGSFLRDTLSLTTGAEVSTTRLAVANSGLSYSLGGLVAAAPRVETLWDKFGYGIENSIELTNQNKINLADQIALLYSLGGRLGTTGESMLQYAERTGGVATVMAFLDEKIEKLSPTMATIQKVAEESGKAFQGYAADARIMTNVTGQSLQELSKAAYSAFVADGHEYGDHWDQFTGDIADAFEKAKGAIVEGIDFLDEKMSDLFSQDSFSAGDILKAITGATKSTVDFGKNLSEITKIAGGQGRALAQYFAGLGADGARAAARVAGASKSTQRDIVAAYNKNRDTVMSLGDQISTKILGTLRDILKLLSTLAEQEWGVTVNVDGNAKDTVADLQRTIAGLTGQPHVINFVARTFKETGVVPDVGPTGGGGGGGSGGGGAGSVHQKAAGGIIRGATGFITKRPTYLVGEGPYRTPAGRGGEAVIPLNARGRRFMQEAWGDNDRGGTQVIVGELTLTEKSKAYIKAVIREEVNGAYVEKKMGRQTGRRFPG